MDQNGSKWIKMDQNGSKWIELDFSVTDNQNHTVQGSEWFHQCHC